MSKVQQSEAACVLQEFTAGAGDSVRLSRWTGQVLLR